MKVCIVGCERSGTSAVSNLFSIASHKNILDDPEYTWYLYPLINIHNIFSFKLFIDINTKYIVKVPGFVTILPYLRKINVRTFKTIYMIRDPRDNISSIIERLNIDLNGLLINVQWLGISPGSIEEALAYRWRKYLEKAIQYQTEYPKDILFIRYEDFITAKLDTIENIGNFTETNIDTELIKDKINIQFRKSWSKTINEKGHYKKILNQDQVNTICDITKELMLKFNYDLE